MHARRFGVVSVEPPLTLPLFKLNMVVPRPALEDAGLAWLVGCLAQTGVPPPRSGPARRRG
jgi:hypothetical protein